MDGKQKKASIDELSLEERDFLERNIMGEGMLIEMAVLVKELGSEKALNALLPYARLSGRAFSINMHNIFEIEGSDTKRIADVSQFWDNLGGAADVSQDIEISSDKIIRAGFLNCMYKSAVKEFCIWVHEMILNGVCEEINPEYECRFTQMVTKGDPMCSYIIEKKKK
jgi:hypothetical protein